MQLINFSDTVAGLSFNLKPYAINLTRNIDEANDLLQETMYRALINKEKYRDGTNLKAWLFTIMRNIFINGYRRKARQNTIIDTTDNNYYINSNNNSIKNKAEGAFVMQDAMKAVNGLNEEYKVPFLMHYKGFKYQEIAEDLSLPLGTVKSRIFFARKALKKELVDYRQN